MKSSLAATISTFQQVAKSFHHISLNFQSHAEKRAFSQQQFKCLQQLFVMNFSKKKLDISFFFIKLWLNNRTSLDNSCMTRQTFIFFFLLFSRGDFSDNIFTVDESRCDEKCNRAGLWLIVAYCFCLFECHSENIFQFFCVRWRAGLCVCVCLRAKL